MCGIFGEFRFSATIRQAEEYFPRLISMMTRRGPDDEGTWTDSKFCVFGFRRLSILDLASSGHQPMTTADGRYTLIFNGEVYNFRELRILFEREGVAFRSTGDAEVVLYALAIWGVEALSKFNGMFALAFYDGVEKKLLLARDHAGIKPLYYLKAKDGLVFASQYDQLLRHPWKNGLQVSDQALALYLRLGYIPAPFAIIENTSMLAPGTWLQIDTEGGIKTGEFYSFPVYTEPDLSGIEAYEQVNDAVRTAVRRHLVSDVPLGIFLSGGIDSPLVASHVRSAQADSIPAFTIGTNGDRHDEVKEAARYASDFGFEHIVHNISPSEAIQILDDVIQACSEPFADYSIFPSLMVSRLASQRVKVVLSGDGGDELFWGYVDRFSSILENSRNFMQPLWMRESRRQAGRLLRSSDRSGWLQYPSIGDWYFNTHTRISTHSLKTIFPGLDFEATNEMFQFHGYKPDETAQWLRWNEFVTHLTMVLLKVDRASMYHSLEVRVPLLDREVINIACRIDWQSCLDIPAGVGKIPLRHALAKQSKNQTKAKRGFEVPMDAWMRGELRPIFEEYVLAAKDLVGVPLKQDAIRKLFNEHCTGLADRSRGLWLLLSLALWEKKHLRAC